MSFTAYTFTTYAQIYMFKAKSYSHRCKEVHGKTGQARQEGEFPRKKEERSSCQDWTGDVSKAKARGGISEKNIEFWVPHQVCCNSVVRSGLSGKRNPTIISPEKVESPADEEEDSSDSITFSD